MGMMEDARGGKDLYATFETSEGTIVCRLFPKDAPVTVENFVGLASGEKAWTHPGTREQVTGKALYDGTIFHRCIADFMIQGGDPLGKGTGGPGYQFEDEFKSGRKFDKPGLLAMANAGPNTNGSQFFITEVPTPHLDGRHTVFGRTISGTELVGQMTRVEKLPGDRPKTDIVLKTILIGRGKAKK
jgi:peptidyl-prolyl cis-trans isomerase A (cyclophilin A)